MHSFTVIPISNFCLFFIYSSSSSSSSASGALAQSGCWGYKTIMLVKLCEDGSPMPSPKTWRARVTLLDWHLVKSLLGCILVPRTEQGALFLFAEYMCTG